MVAVAGDTIPLASNQPGSTHLGLWFHPTQQVQHPPWFSKKQPAAAPTLVSGFISSTRMEGEIMVGSEGPYTSASKMPTWPGRQWRGTGDLKMSKFPGRRLLK